jgi:hypothetical protein
MAKAKRVRARGERNMEIPGFINEMRAAVG